MNIQKAVLAIAGGLVLGNGKMAFLTGSSPATRFDREQVRDIALSVKVAK